MSEPIEERQLYRGRIVDLRSERVRLPDGTESELEVVRHPGAAAVMVVDDSRRVCLLRQYRHAAGGWIWEFPAGKLDPGEEPADAVRRELEEETGILARDWCPLGTTLTAPGFTDEVIHLFLATANGHRRARREPGEIIEVHWLPLQKVIAMARDDEIRDAKTLALLLRALPLFPLPAGRI